MKIEDDNVSVHVPAPAPCGCVVCVGCVAERVLERVGGCMYR